MASLYTKLLGTIITASLTLSISAQKVSPEKMQAVYEQVKTPHKYGLVITPADKSKKIDCPTVFRKGRHWYMTYIVFDGKGYETWLAKSRNLLQWQTLGRLLSFSDSMDWDANQKAGYLALQDTRWGGSYKLRRYKGKYFMSYIGGKDKGYEAGPLAIGVASTGSNPARPHEWRGTTKPVFSITDKDVRWWENRKLFKSSVIEDKDRQTGHRFVMYYNANGDTTGVPATRWFERIGMAVSDDMEHWQRYLKEPVLMHSKGITGDAVLQRMGDLWVMFYFGAFWEGRKDAFNRFACSYDLVNWTDWTGDDLVKSTEPYDSLYAHKSFVVKHKGVVYHYYCAVNKGEQRGIAVATSVDKGKSALQFVK